jgi:hypothetical protein
MRSFPLIFLFVTMIPPMQAQSAADSAAIRATAMDYMQGWYTGDTVRMGRALHPELAKRIVNTDSNGVSRLSRQEAVGPYTRFVRAERERLTTTREELRRIRTELERLQAAIGD